MKPRSKPTRPIEVVYCYSPDSEQDENLRNELEKHLMTMQREGVITAWDKRKITAGEEEESQINKYLDKARIILLLVSSDFIASDECYHTYLGRATERHEAAEAYAIPVLLRPVDLRNSWIGNMEIMPKNAVPVTLWDNLDQAFLNIAEALRELVQEIWHRDELGVDDAYNKLKEQLAAREWRNADEATKAIVFKVCGREQTGSLTSEDIKKFPLRDIRAINNLWVEYSKGRFGFSVQQRILQQTNYECFITDVGWRVDDTWLEYENIDFTLTAPEGHLPYCGVHFWKAIPSVPPESPRIPYYRLPGSSADFYNRYPYNRTPPYYLAYKQQRELDRLIKRRPFDPQPSYPSGGGGGGALIVVGIIAAVAGIAWAVDKVDEKFFREDREREKEERERQKWENEIQEKINAILSRLDS